MNKENKVVDITSHKNFDKPWFRKKEELYETCSTMPKSSHAFISMYELMTVLVESLASLHGSLFDDQEGKKLAQVDLNKLPIEKQHELEELLDSHNRRTMMFMSKVEEIIGLKPDSEMQLGCWPGEILDYQFDGREGMAEGMYKLQSKANAPIYFKNPISVEKLIDEYIGEDRSPF